MEQYKINLLKLVAKHDLYYDFIWNENLEFSVICNDVFYRGLTDAEDINSQEDVDMLEQAIEDCLVALKPEGRYYSSCLFAARKRKMRPLTNEFSQFMDEGIRNLFEACGPEREDRYLFPELKEGIDELKKRRLKKDLDVPEEAE